MKKRLLAILLGVVIILSTISTVAMAASAQDPASTKGGIGALFEPTGSLNTAGNAAVVYYGGKPWYVLDTSYGANGQDDTTTGVLLLSKYVFSYGTQWLAYHTSANLSEGSSANGGYLGSDIRGYLNGSNTWQKNANNRVDTYTFFRNAMHYGDTPTSSNVFNYWVRKTVDTATADKTGGPYFIKDTSVPFAASGSVTFSSAAQFNKAQEGTELYTYDSSADTYSLATTWVSGTSYYFDTAAYIKADVSETGFDSNTTYYTFYNPKEGEFIKVGNSNAPGNVAKVYYYCGYSVTGLSASATGASREPLGGESTQTNNFANKLGLSDIEKAAILATSRDALAESDSTAGALNADTFFLLSLTEATSSEYGLGTNLARKAYYYGNGGAARWWLRSNTSKPQVKYIADGGSDAVYNANASANGIRPAFNLDPNSVLFTSDYSSGKGALGAISEFLPLASSSTTTFKLTLKDSSISAPSYSLLKKNADGTYSIKYSGGHVGEGNYVSAIIKDADGNIYGYAKLGNTAEGEATLQVPAGIELGDTYKLYIFNEVCSTSKEGTDYASELVECSDLQTISSIEVSPANGYSSSYVAKTQFNNRQIVVTAVYSNGESIVLRDNDFTVTMPESYTQDGFRITVGEPETQTIVITSSEDTSVTANYEVTVSKATVIKPAADDTSFVYDGTEQTYYVPDNDLYEVTGTKRTEAGTQTVTVSLKNTVDYKWADGTIDDVTFDFTIDKAEYDMSNIRFTDRTFVYDGSAHNPTISGTLPTGEDGIRVTVSYIGSATYVTDGTVTVTAVFATQSNNYKTPESKTATVTISKANPEFEWPVDLVGVGGDPLSSIALPDGFSWADSDQIIDCYVSYYTLIYTPADTDNYNTMSTEKGVSSTHAYGSLVPRVEPTCSAIGFEIHYRCSACDKYFTYDHTETTEDDLIIPRDLDAHSYGEASYAWADDSSSCTATRVCVHNGEHSESETVAATAVITQSKSCTDDELTKYTVNFTNSAFEAQVKENVKTADKLGHEYGELIPRVDATCSATGFEAHYLCDVCDTYFTAEKADTTAADLTIAIDDDAHSYGATAYIWAADHSACTAIRVCARNSAHKDTETAVVVKTVIQALSCTDEEICSFNATFKGVAFAAQAKENVTTAAALGHAYGELIEKVDASCAATGFEAHYLCSGCSVMFNEEKTEVTAEDMTIAIIEDAHSYNVPRSNIFSHWSKCDHCDEIDGQMNHSFVNGVCSCGYKQTTIILAIVLSAEVFILFAMAVIFIFKRRY